MTADQYLGVTGPQWLSLEIIVDRADSGRPITLVKGQPRGGGVNVRTADALVRRKFVERGDFGVRPTLHGRNALGAHLRIRARHEREAEASVDPRWLTQTILRDPDKPEIMGNCWQTCVASLLNLPLDEVPHFVQDHETLAEVDAATRRWARARGFDFWEVPVATVAGSPVLCMLGGRSPRDVRHVVIGRGDHPLHDPHPTRAGLAVVETAYLFVPFDPAPEVVS